MSSASKRAAIAARAAVPSGATAPPYARRRRRLVVVAPPVEAEEVAPPEPEAVRETWTRGECAAKARPCTRLACRHHLLWAQPRHRLRRLSDDDLAELVTTMPETCTLDVAERDHPPSLEEVGAALGLTRERVRQIEAEGLAKIRRRLPLWRGLRELGGDP